MDVLFPTIGEIIGGSSVILTTLSSAAYRWCCTSRIKICSYIRHAPASGTIASQRFRFGLRAADALHHGDGQYSRRDTLPAHAVHCELRRVTPGAGILKGAILRLISRRHVSVYPILQGFHLFSKTLRRASCKIKNKKARLFRYC